MSQATLWEGYSFFVYNNLLGSGLAELPKGSSKYCSTDDTKNTRGTVLPGKCEGDASCSQDEDLNQPKHNVSPSLHQPFLVKNTGYHYSQSGQKAGNA